MSTKTIYESTVTIPIYASWRCEECGEINFARGEIICRCSESSYSLSKQKNQEAKELASKKADLIWLPFACRIIEDPISIIKETPSALRIDNSNCAKCEKKARWNKSRSLITYLATLTGLSILTSGFIALDMLTSVAVWSVFALSIGFLALILKFDTAQKKALEGMHKRYAPIIGSQNPELLKYAESRGFKIPTPEECIEIAQNGNIASIKLERTTKNRFCHSCGAKLLSDSDFCHNCGTKINE